MKTAVSQLVRKLSNYLPTIDEEETNAEVMSHFENQERDVVLFYKYFSSAFKGILSAMKVSYEETTSMSRELEKHVLKVLGEHLQGCTVRCPFCTATCSNATKEHTQDHQTFHHYPVCLNGFAGKTADGQLNLQTCPELVKTGETFIIKDVQVKIPMKTKFINFFKYGAVSYNSNKIPFKDYRIAYTDWKIHSKGVRQKNLFWKMFLGKFSPQLADFHGCTVPDDKKIEMWSKYTRADVLNSMSANPWTTI